MYYTVVYICAYKTLGVNYWPRKRMFVDVEMHPSRIACCFDMRVDNIVSVLCSTPSVSLECHNAQLSLSNSQEP